MSIDNEIIYRCKRGFLFRKCCQLPEKTFLLTAVCPPGLTTHQAATGPSARSSKRGEHGLRRGKDASLAALRRAKGELDAAGTPLKGVTWLRADQSFKALDGRDCHYGKLMRPVHDREGDRAAPQGSQLELSAPGVAVVLDRLVLGCGFFRPCGKSVRQDPSAVGGSFGALRGF